jgi:anti-sigma28 factor (negative regulator of flagellin synthesis)
MDLLREEVLAHMEVNNSNVTDNSALGAGKTQQADPTGQPGRASAGELSGSGSSDRVDMSNLASALGGDSARRASRVDRLTDSVSSGQYQVDSAAVSKAIVHAAIEDR